MDNSSLTPTPTPTRYRGSASFWTITVLLTVILIVIIALLVHIFTRKDADEAILQCRTQNEQSLLLSLLLNNKQSNIPKAHNDTDERKTAVVLPVMAVNTTQNPSLVPKPEDERKSDMIMNLKTLVSKPEDERKSDMIMNLKTLGDKNDIVANLKTLEERGKTIETKIKEEAKIIANNNALKK